MVCVKRAWPKTVEAWHRAFDFIVGLKQDLALPGIEEPA